MSERFQLETQQGKLCLIDTTKQFKPFYVDCENITKRLKPERLAQAIGITSNNPLFVIDATAGFGQDSLLLARLGCRILLLEQNAMVSALLEDGLKRAWQNPKMHSILKNIIEFKKTNAIDFLNRLNKTEKPDVIYLDPMFPKRPKNALVKKPMQILQTLVEKTKADQALFNIALKQAKQRIVVKRPRFSPSIETAHQPHHILKGKTTCFEIYLPTD